MKLTWLKCFLCLICISCAGYSSTVFSDQILNKNKPSFAVASAHPAATQAGFDILKAGGNAFDAAVAVSAALAVVEPYSSGLGGGGFWLLHRQRDQYQVMIDGREKAPLAAHRDMYLDVHGEVIKDLSIDGPLAAGIPGTPAALVHITENYGRLSLVENLQPAIRLARQGFKATEHYQRMAGWRLNAINSSAEASEIFLVNGKVPKLGANIVQPDLAETLIALARNGHEGFYGGLVANNLVAAVRKDGGIWTLKDLEDYRVVERTPMQIFYQNMQITTASLPSSGGIVLTEIFHILENFSLDTHAGTTQLHLIIEAMRRAYRDRAEYLGDSDYVSVPEHLAARDYAKYLSQDIIINQATPSSGLRPVNIKMKEGNDTTHFSIVDTEGNRVAATLSINYPFGSGFVAAGTGVLLNDEMDDFSSKPGVPNIYGLVGAEANAIAPGKRMLSSMSPTFLETDDSIAILGTPGGSRIITMVLLAALAFEKGFTAQEIVDLPRVHHQYLPDVVEFEPDSIPAAFKVALEKMGHTVITSDNSWGNMQVVTQNRKTGELQAVSDRRGEGYSLVE